MTGQVQPGKGKDHGAEKGQTLQRAVSSNCCSSKSTLCKAANMSTSIWTSTRRGPMHLGDSATRTKWSSMRSKASSWPVTGPATRRAMRMYRIRDSAGRYRRQSTCVMETRAHGPLRPHPTSSPPAVPRPHRSRVQPSMGRSQCGLAAVRHGLLLGGLIVPRELSGRSWPKVPRRHRSL